MPIITRRITNLLNHSFTIPCPGSNNNQNANLIIPSSAIDLDLLTLTTEDNLWTLQPQLTALQSSGAIVVTGTFNTATIDYDGVATLQADSNPLISGAVQLVSGSHITLSQTGQAITVNATGELSTSLTNSHILVGNGSNVATDVAMSGDTTISNTGATTVGSVGGSSASNIHSAELSANAATNANTASTIVKRDGSGNFSAGTITAALTGTASGNLTSATGVTDVHADSSSALHGSVQLVSGTNVTLSQVGQAITINSSDTGITQLTSDVTAGPGNGSQAATVASVGGSSAANVHSAELAANAATSTNTASTIVKRDGSGNFSAGTVSSVNVSVSKEVTFTTEVPNTISGSASTIDWTQGNKQKLSVNSSATLTFINPAGPASVLLRVVHDATGTTYTLTWPMAVKWAGGTPPTFTQTANAVDIVSFYFDGTNYWGVGSTNFS